MSLSTETSYQRFLRELRSIRTLSYVRNLLDWDEQVYMPIASADGRSEQVAMLAELIHERRTAPAFVELLQKLSADNDLPEDAQVNVREVWRDVERALKISRQLVSAIAQAESRSYNTWIEARKRNDFSVVQSALTELVALKREYAQLLAGNGKPYDALLDLYEPGLTQDFTREIFSKLGGALQTLLGKIVEKAGPLGVVNPAKANFPRDRQREVCRYVAELIGFDFSRGRLDETIHPFCNDTGFDDVRLTTRFHDDDVSAALYSTLHEAGHGLYEQGYQREYQGTPLGEYCSMAIHESQSRIWENNYGRSREFVDCVYPYLQREFPEAYQGVSALEFFRYVNRVRPSLIRVEADEVSYGLHVILRFELEQLLFSGKLEVGDLPQAWNEKYRQHLGIAAEDDLHGVLQDVHWYGGNFGYFPTYLLGTAYAAQLFSAIARDIGDLSTQLIAGKTESMQAWLNQKIHRHGKRFNAMTLIQQASGEAPKADFLISYLNKKFGELYQLS